MLPGVGATRRRAGCVTDWFTTYRETVMKSKWSAWMAGALASAVALPGIANAQISDGVVKIGVLTDMSSLYADITGPGSLLAAQMAVEDFGAAKKGMRVEVVSADHQNKPDVGASIARQ